MIAIEVVFLTGRYVATAHDRRGGHEWPPHWARMYSALVAAWADEEDEDEAALLRDMEIWGHPSIGASDAALRRVPAHWVPVNDTTVLGLGFHQRQATKLEAGLSRMAELGPEAPSRQVEAAQKRIAGARDVSNQVRSIGKTPPARALELLPEHRVRQERRFPSVTPHEPRVLFIWEEIERKPEWVDRLDQLLSRVVRLGHSSSLVSCRVLPDPQQTVPQPRFVPDDRAQVSHVRLRSIGVGQLDALIAGYQRHRASEPRSMPHRAAIYRDRTIEPEGAPPPDVSVMSGEMIIFTRREGPRLPITASVRVARALRGTLMAHAEDPLPEIISGHRPDDEHRGASGPSTRPHAAYLALPFVGSRYATGHLLGAAIVLPHGVSPEEKAHVEAAIASARSAAGGSTRPRRALPGLLRITFGTGGVLSLAPVTDDQPAVGLRPETWSRPARTWTSVTPIALPRHPGSLSKGSHARRGRAWKDAAAAVVSACRHVGLTEPTNVELELAPMMVGSRDARAFPVFTQGSQPKSQIRALVHAQVTFPHPVVGPVLLGSGRYQGLGLMRPVMHR